eukprot:TRINITY_DN3994_c2_g1_i1.p2 TRINITY_DN3994_c2_g1~~TRINITY_DN3994_c2_g1_i1.p2  ORF type:complete len:117 (-),score=3.73 TRINITY_DN3994_c2_g1_i1:76-426(-)
MFRDYWFIKYNFIEFRMTFDEVRKVYQKQNKDINLLRRFKIFLSILFLHIEFRDYWFIKYNFIEFRMTFDEVRKVYQKQNKDINLLRRFKIFCRFYFFILNFEIIGLLNTILQNLE